MLKKITLFVLALSLSTHIFSQGMDDPFQQAVVGGQSVDAAAVSSGEIPSFAEFKKNHKESTTPRMMPQELETLRNDEEQRIFVLDARSKEEYNVSHIRRAKRVGFKTFTSERVWMLNREQTTIVYCANSENSKVVADYLRLMGFIDVYVLEDGLINWKNQGYEVVDANDEVTDRVHVHERSNARLLKNGKSVN